MDIRACLAAVALASCAGMAAVAPFSLMVNVDNDHFFIQDSSLMTREDLRAYVDAMADGGQVSEIVFCACGQPANWDSKAWEPMWKRLDDFPEAFRKNPKWRVWPANLKLLHDKGIDPYKVWIERCREKGVGAWLSMRMNDVHFTTHRRMYVTRTVAFWRDHPELRRHPEIDPFAGGHDMHLRWKYFALDYSKPAAYAYSLAMAREMLERYAPDGLELDWMRYVTHLTPGKEREQSGILTAFMRDVRKLADAEGARRGRRIAISARIPSRYGNARALGYDPEAWAREGLCDLFIPCNKDSADFACDVDDWKRRLAPAKVIPGMDRLDCAGGEKVYADLAGYHGWADAMHARGADGLYLFNAPYLPEEVKGELWRKGLAAGQQRQRRFIASYADSAPDEIPEEDLPQLPWPLSKPSPLSVPAGTCSPSDAISVVLAFDAPPPDGVAVRLNGIAATSSERIDGFGKAYGDPKKVKAARRWRFPKGTPVGIMAKVEVEAVPDCAVRVMWCEIVAESGAK